MLRPFQMSTEWSQCWSNKDIKERCTWGTTNWPTLQTWGHLMPCSFQVGSGWPKAKGWLEGQLIWCIELCAKMIAIDQSLSSPVWRTVQKDGSIQHSSIAAFHFKKVNNISMREIISYTARWRKLLCPESFWNFAGWYHQIWISVQEWKQIFFAHNFPAPQLSAFHHWLHQEHWQVQTGAAMNLMN